MYYSVFYQNSDGFHIKEGEGDMGDDHVVSIFIGKQISLFEYLCEAL